MSDSKEKFIAISINKEIKNLCPDLDQIDYVSEWTDLEGLDLDKLLNIHRKELINKIEYEGKYDFNDFELTENVYNEVKKCYNSSNPEEVIWNGK